MAEVVLGRGRRETGVGRNVGGALLQGLKGAAAWWFYWLREFVKATGGPPSYLSGPDPWVRR